MVLQMGSILCESGGRFFNEVGNVADRLPSDIAVVEHNGEYRRQLFKSRGRLIANDVPIQHGGVFENTGGHEPVHCGLEFEQ